METTKNEINTPEGRDWLLGLLRKGEAIVTFTKKNGEERKMTSTLNFDLIPKEHHPKNPIVKEEVVTDTKGLTWDDLDPEQEEILGRDENGDLLQEEQKTLAVYDLNAKGWRSFLWANVKQVEFSLEKQNG